MHRFDAKFLESGDHLFAVDLAEFFDATSIELGALAGVFLLDLLNTLEQVPECAQRAANAGGTFRGKAKRRRLRSLGTMDYVPGIIQKC